MADYVLYSFETLRPPRVSMKQEPYWSPFHATEGPSTEQFPLEPNTKASEIVKKLDATFDGFMIGTVVKLEYGKPGKGLVEESVVLGDGTLYVPEERSRLIDLREVEETFPNLVPIMLEIGLTSALQVPNGAIAYNPEMITLVRDK